MGPISISNPAFFFSGYESVVILTGNITAWKNEKLMKYVMDQLIALETNVVLMEVNPEQALLASTISRVFVPVILPWETKVRDSEVGNNMNFSGYLRDE